MITQFCIHSFPFPPHAVWVRVRAVSPPSRKRRGGGGEAGVKPRARRARRWLTSSIPTPHTPFFISHLHSRTPHAHAVKVHTTPAGPGRARTHFSSRPNARTHTGLKKKTAHTHEKHVCPLFFLTSSFFLSLSFYACFVCCSSSSDLTTLTGRRRRSGSQRRRTRRRCRPGSSGRRRRARRRGPSAGCTGS